MWCTPAMPDVHETDESGLPGLFDGLTVLEIGQYVAAPIAAELFAHGGADVIKLEPVKGDISRGREPINNADGRQYVIKARGKRGLPLDISSPQGRQVAHDLAANADVVISNLRPGGAERLGLDYATLSAANPGLIYGEINGYGFEGPLANDPSIDLIAQAWTGLYPSASYGPDGRSHRYEVFFADYIAGLLCAFGVASALYHRQLTGEGQHVTTSLAAAALYAQHRYANLFDSDDNWKRAIAARRAAGATIADVWADRLDHYEPDLYFNTTYDTADGAIAVGAPGALGPRFCALFGLTDPRETDAWADRDRRFDLLREIRNQVAAALAELPTEEVLARTAADGIPAAPVRTLEELLVDPDAHAAGLVYEAEHPRLGNYIMATAPVGFSAADYRARVDTPAFGAHTDAVLTDLGYEPAVIERLVADGIVARARPDGSSLASATG